MSVGAGTRATPATTADNLDKMVAQGLPPFIYRASRRTETVLVFARVSDILPWMQPLGAVWTAAKGPDGRPDPSVQLAVGQMAGHWIKLVYRNPQVQPVSKGET